MINPSAIHRRPVVPAKSSMVFKVCPLLVILAFTVVFLVDFLADFLVDLLADFPVDFLIDFLNEAQLHGPFESKVQTRSCC